MGLLVFLDGESVVVGLCVRAVGDFVGERDGGLSVGDLVGLFVDFVGDCVGDHVSLDLVGATDGAAVVLVGNCVGFFVGAPVTNPVGLVGGPVGL